MWSLAAAVALRGLGRDAQAERSATQPKPWGFWATLAWIGATYLMVIASQKLFPLPWDELQRWSKQGTLGFFASQLGYGLVHLLLLVAPLLIAARLAGWSIGEYFALSRPRLRDLAIYSCAPLGIMVGKTLASLSAMRAGTGLSSADALLLLWAGVFPIIFAPLWEELVFRGFVFRGLAQSPLGSIGAIVLSSLLWTGMHPLLNGPQSILYLLFVFVDGLYLGWVRHRTGSMPLTILFHAMFNVPYQLAGTVIILGWIH